jgi:hypothetical protein
MSDHGGMKQIVDKSLVTSWMSIQIGSSLNTKKRCGHGLVCAKLTPLRMSCGKYDKPPWVVRLLGQGQICNAECCQIQLDELLSSETSLGVVGNVSRATPPYRFLAARSR